MRAEAALLGIMLLLISCAHSPRPWTNTEKAVAVASVIASAADCYTTTQFNNNPNNYEVNPLISRHPSDGRVIITMGITEGITLLVAHYWDDYRIWLLGGKAMLNTGLAIHNRTLD